MARQKANKILRCCNNRQIRASRTEDGPRLPPCNCMVKSNATNQRRRRILDVRIGSSTSSHSTSIFQSLLCTGSKLGEDHVTSTSNSSSLPHSQRPFNNNNQHETTRLTHGPRLAPYTYTPLARPKDFRLLEVLPGGQDDVVCSLLPADINCAPSYSAISYVWGGQTPSVGIRCDRKTLMVTLNLHSLICRVRTSRSPKRIWIDAICINQSDNTEKNQQLRLMGKIYNTADQVLVWLGNDETSIARPTIDLMRRIAGGQGSTAFYDHPTISSLDFYDSLRTFFNRDWFWRIWCIQEVALSASTRVLWGEAELRWEVLAAATAYIVETPGWTDFDIQVPGAFNAYLTNSLFASGGALKVPFLHLLMLTRQFESTDPRDRIFALCGLRTLDSDPESGKLFIQPDYNQSVADVYCEFARTSVTKMKSLHVLSAVQHGHSISDDFPSWVPRWDKGSSHILAQLDPEKDMFSASDGLALSYVDLGDPSILYVKGLSCDTIIEISEPCPAMDTGVDRGFGRSGLSLLRKFASAAWSRLITPWRACLGSKKEVHLRFGFTLIAGKDSFGNLVRYSHFHHKDFEFFLPLNGLQPRFDNPDSEFEQAEGVDDDDENNDEGSDRDDSEDSSEDMNADSRSSSFLTAIARACVGRRLFLTSKGYLGLGPRCVQPHDLVSILGGGTVPYILRPKKSEREVYNFVGEAFVDGIMHGEAFTQMDEQRMAAGSLREFMLC